MKERFIRHINDLQDQITSTLEKIDGSSSFKEEHWERAEGGGGRTRVIENGRVFEKGGVNVSAVHGTLPESMQEMLKVKASDFFACGLSLVIHPKNPFVPTVHANWRYFELYDSSTKAVIDRWFGGGQDLTPYYLFDEDAKHFHQVCKDACERHHPVFYKNFKKHCDDYLRNIHRNEARGIGGLFFDYCRDGHPLSIEAWYRFVIDTSGHFLDSYIPIVLKRKDIPYEASHREWQEIRRGRYVEFNLIYDKGTLFGLKTNGRTESIFMSLPPHVQWKYDHQPAVNSKESQLLKILETPKEWL